MSTTTSCASSTGVHSTDGSSVTSASYTTASYSTVDPPSHLRLPYNNHNHDANQSMISGLSDPSASTASHGGYHNNNTLAIFPPVVEETNSALDDTSSPSTPTAPTGNGTYHSQKGSYSPKDADGVNIEINTNTRTNNSNNMQQPPSPAGPHLPLECDYDTNPTVLYQIIEAKKWDIFKTLFDKEPLSAKKQAATWVTRKEPNGKLRWRLLPVHAAVIFQSPAFVVEKLLEECPEAAQAKDDQGMLPLHLAFRTKHTCWETIEELISAHPQAVFVNDRKGRTPLECGLAAAAAVMEAEKAMQQTVAPSPTSKGLMGALSPRASAQAKPEPQQKGIDSPAIQKSIFSVLELYTQVSVQDHLQTAMTNSRKALETRIGAVQDNHVATLTQLKNSWENQRNELSRKIQGYRKEIQNLKSDFNIQQELLEEKVNTEMELVDKLQQVTTALEAKTLMDEDTAEEVARDITNMHSHDLREANKKAEVLKKTNKELLLLLETLLDQQNSLKLSLDKLSWDTSAKNKERQDLLNKYFAVHEQSVEMAETYTQDWQERLEKTSVEVSAKLARILSQNKSGGGTKENRSAAHFTYDGEEKKEPYITVHDSTTSASSISASHQDP